MKRLIALLALFCILLCGCSKQQDIDDPVTFYYPRASIEYVQSEIVIGTESRESSGFDSDLTGLLNLYVAGPESAELVNPFPEDCSVVSAVTENGSCTIVLSDSFADLTGLQLSMACTSLGMTAAKITSSESVVIRTESRLLDGEETRSYQASSVHFKDDYIPETQP